MENKSYSIATPSFISSQKTYQLEAKPVFTTKSKIYGFELQVISPFIEKEKYYPLEFPPSSREKGILFEDIHVLADKPIRAVGTVLNQYYQGLVRREEKGADIAKDYLFGIVKRESNMSIVAHNIAERQIDTLDTVFEDYGLFTRIIQDTRIIESIETTIKEVVITLELEDYIGTERVIKEYSSEIIDDEHAVNLLKILHGTVIVDKAIATTRRKMQEVKQLEIELAERKDNLPEFRIEEFDDFDAQYRPTYQPDVLWGSGTRPTVAVVLEDIDKAIRFSEVDALSPYWTELVFADRDIPEGLSHLHTFDDFDRVHYHRDSAIDGGFGLFERDRIVEFREADDIAFAIRDLTYEFKQSDDVTYGFRDNIQNASVLSIDQSHRVELIIPSTIEDMLTAIRDKEVLSRIDGTSSQFSRINSHEALSISSYAFNIDSEFDGIILDSVGSQKSLENLIYIDEMTSVNKSDIYESGIEVFTDFDPSRFIPEAIIDDTTEATDLAIFVDLLEFDLFDKKTDYHINIEEAFLAEGNLEVSALIDEAYSSSIYNDTFSTIIAEFDPASIMNENISVIEELVWGDKTNRLGVIIDETTMSDKHSNFTAIAATSDSFYRDILVDITYGDLDTAERGDYLAVGIDHAVAIRNASYLVVQEDVDLFTKALFEGSVPFEFDLFDRAMFEGKAPTEFDLFDRTIFDAKMPEEFDLFGRTIYEMSIPEKFDLFTRVEQEGVLDSPDLFTRVMSEGTLDSVDLFSRTIVDILIDEGGHWFTRTSYDTEILESVKATREMSYNSVIEEFTNFDGPEQKEYTWLWHSRPSWWSSWGSRKTK